MKINIINSCSDLGVTIDGSRLGPKKIKKYIFQFVSEIQYGF